MIKFVFIDDDINNRKQWLRWAKRKGYEAETFDNILEAVKIRADFYIFDISTIGGTFNEHYAYSPICKLIEMHPGSIVVIVSAVSKTTVEAIIEDVYERMGVKPLYGGWGTYKDFEKAIRDYL